MEKDLLTTVLEQCDYYTKAFNDLCDYMIEGRSKHFKTRLEILEALDHYEQEFIAKIDGVTGLAFSLGLDNCLQVFEKYLDIISNTAKEKRATIYTKDIDSSNINFSEV